MKYSFNKSLVLGLLVLLLPFDNSFGYPGQIITVFNKTQLTNAVKGVTGGEEIRLAPGNYGNSYWRDIFPSSEVKIVSRDNNNKAVIELLDFRRGKNFTFNRIKFDQNHVGKEWRQQTLTMHDVDNVKVTNCEIKAGRISARDGRSYGTGNGLYVLRGENFLLEDNKIYNLFVGSRFLDSDNITVRSNEYFGIGGDALNFAQVTDAVIEENYVHDIDNWTDWGHHNDMLQIWTTSTTAPSTNVTIRRNVFYTGEANGRASQTIHIRNEEFNKSGTKLNIRNVTLDNNFVYNATVHGIWVADAIGVNITNNTLIFDDDAKYDYEGVDVTYRTTAPMIHVSDNSTNVKIQKNASKLSYTVSTKFTASQHYYLNFDDPSGDGFYPDEFVGPNRNNPSLDDLAPKSGSGLSKSGFGSNAYYGSTRIKLLGGAVAPPAPPESGFSIIGRFFFDDNNSNTKNSTDSGVSGANVNLLTSNKATVIARTTTDGNGDYSFSNVENGWYAIQFVKKSSQSFVTNGFGGNESLDSDVKDKTNGYTGAFEVKGSTIRNVDAGVVGSTTTSSGNGVITGRYFVDNNENEYEDEGDTGVSGASVSLFKASNNKLIATTVTNSNGVYRFDKLVSDWYYAGFKLPSGEKFIRGNIGGSSKENVHSDVYENRSGIGVTSAVQVVGTSTVSHLDAGILPDVDTSSSSSSEAVISGRYFNDNNKNNIEDSGDTGVVGVTVHLTYGNEIVDTTVTNSDGRYSFKGMNTGWHKVYFQKLTGKSFVSGSSGSNRNIDSDVWTVKTLSGKSYGVARGTNITGSNSTFYHVDAGIK